MYLKVLNTLTSQELKKLSNQHFFRANVNSGGGLGNDVNECKWHIALVEYHSMFIFLSTIFFYLHPENWGNDPIWLKNWGTIGEMIQFDEHIFEMGGSTTN